MLFRGSNIAWISISFNSMSVAFARSVNKLGTRKSRRKERVHRLGREIVLPKGYSNQSKEGRGILRVGAWLISCRLIEAL